MSAALSLRPALALPLLLVGCDLPGLPPVTPAARHARAHALDAPATPGVTVRPGRITDAEAPESFD